MEKIYDLYEKYKDYILFGCFFIIIVVSEVLLFWYFSNEIKDIKSVKETKVITIKKDLKKEFLVDIKGQVKRPGVYSLKEGKRVIDVVKKAGGFTDSADTSANNLSMKIKDEMVIVIYSEYEIENYLITKENEKKVLEKCKTDTIINNSCISDEDSSDLNNNNDDSNNSNNDSSLNETKLVSINNGTKEELMTLPGIGESKALSIIEYRKKIKFEKIEDLKNVSGIGDAIFDKLKEYITL